MSERGVLAELALQFGIISVVAIGGGNAVLPEMHRMVVDVHGWMTSETFANLYALAQAAPGPNILVASVMGWRIGGWGGMAMATVGMLLPAAVLAWIMAGLVQRLRGAPWLKPAQGGLVPIAVGLLLAAGLVMAEASSQFGLLPLVVVAVSSVFVWRTSYSPLWVLVGGGVLGSILLR
jgi:chromate transporter